MSQRSYHQLSPGELEFVDDQTAALLLNTRAVPALCCG